MKRLFSVLLYCLIYLFYACSSPSEQTNNRKKKLVATTGMVADMARNVLGDLVDIQVLMGPGVDPHLYKASQGDMNLLSEELSLKFIE
jgi:manganese/zinc/iron transport system substrate-binding protein